MIHSSTHFRVLFCDPEVVTTRNEVSVINHDYPQHPSIFWSSLISPLSALRSPLSIVMTQVGLGPFPMQNWLVVKKFRV